MRLATAILVALTILAGPALAVSDAARDPGALPEIGPAPAFGLMSPDGKPEKQAAGRSDAFNRR